MENTIEVNHEIVDRYFGTVESSEGRDAIREVALEPCKKVFNTHLV
jgi:hypothetical protein